ncbi:acyltransferase [Actinomadura sp. NPDC023710]|uniref:acyltransferase family protein n=1 Tax=Actinomadura sp. NPDC023710 TaxID=3158219 RepID=UPI0033F65885
MVTKASGGDAVGAAAPDPASDRPRKFIPELEGLRGAVVLLVVLGHTGVATSVQGWSYMHSTGNGVWAIMLNRVAVAFPIWFVMTGYLLYRAFALYTLTGERKPNAKRYFWRRALRILPAYWVLTITALLVLNRDTVHGVWEWVRPLLLLQIWEHGAIPMGMMHTWSNANDFLFYLAMPVFAWLLHRYARRAESYEARVRRLLVPLAFPVFIGFGFFTWLHFPQFRDDPMKLWPTQYFWPMSYMGWLSVGMMLAVLSAAAETRPDAVPRLYRLIGRHPGKLWLGALLIFVLACLSPLADYRLVDYVAAPAAAADYWLFLAFSVAVFAPLTVPGVRFRLAGLLLDNSLLRFFGRISYSVYLWHIFVYAQFVGPLFAPEVGGYWEVLGVELALCVMVGYASYIFVEKPFHMLRPRLGKAPVELSVAVSTPAEAHATAGAVRTPRDAQA